MQKLENRTSAVLFLGDLAVFVAALILTLLIRYQDIPSAELVRIHLVPFSFLFLIWATVFLIVGLYDQYVSFDRKAIPTRVLKAQAVNILLAAVLFFLLPLSIEPKTNLAIYLIVSTTLLIGWRLYIYPRAVARHALSALVVGHGSEASGVYDVLSRNPFYQQVDVQYLDTGQYQNADVLAAAVEAHIAAHKTDLVIADMDDAVAQKLTPLFFDLVFTKRTIRFFALSDFYEQLHHRIPPSLIKESWLLERVTMQSPHYAYDFLKRALDIVGVVVLAVPCVVVVPLVALAIKVGDGGPIFYRTERIGRYNEPFNLIKFRTMTGMDTGDAALASSLTVTRLGRILRATRIDELPQLLNILRGDLSFIGPRPEMPALARVYAEQIPHYNLRHLIKPGLSGWAQINDVDAPRQGIDIDRTVEKLSYDLYYLRHRSFWLDIEIVLKTIDIVLSRTGR